MIVCLCKAVSETHINQAIDEGLDSFRKLQNSLSVAKQCGACSCEVKSILKHKLEQKRNQVSLLQANSVCGQSITSKETV